MKYLLIFLVFFLLDQRNISGQGNTAQFGTFAVKDFMLPSSPVIDSNTTGVIMADIGSTHFIGNKYHRFSYVYQWFGRMKIVSKKAFDDLATLRVSLYGRGDFKDELTDFKATVYNLENGRLVSTTVNKKDMFEDKLSPFVTENKISLPAIKEGSVIECSYTITSYRIFDIPSWIFQRVGYPCLYSDYEVVFPDAIRYLATHYGDDLFFKDETSTVKNNKYYMGDITVISNDIKRRWVMKDIPSFNDEKFIYSPNDYLDKIEFTLAQTYNGQDVFNLSSSWAAVTNELLEDSYFGAPIEKEAAFNLVSTAERITSGSKDPMESARNIFFYIRDNFVCLPVNSIYLSSDPYDINKKKKGSVADLNLLLVTLLRLKGIDANPVILTTRKYGKNSPEYPLLEKMNYVVCMTRTFTDTIYLDASKPDIGFGQLPLDCYNGHARVISKEGGAVYLSAERIKEHETTSVFISNDGSGKLGGSCESVSGDFKTEILRKKIRASGTRQYFDEIRSDYGNEIEMMNTGIDSLNKPGFPAKIHFEFTIPAKEDILYFNPVIMMEYKQNPFKSEKRKYPVSLPFPINNLYTLNMEIPEGYVIDELPKSVKVSFNDNQGFFEYSIQANQNNLQFRSRISLNEIFFAPGDYQSLRDFFGFIVKKCNEQVVFKKKK
jgi:transglutaminase-like putative cysteine protease